MKPIHHIDRRKSWLTGLLMQCAIMLAVGAIASAARGIHPLFYGFMLWLCVPLAGGWTACRIVLRGLNNYLAWIAPPICLYMAHYLLWGYAPSAGAALLCAFVSLVGAASGEILRHRQ